MKASRIATGIVKIAAAPACLIGSAFCLLMGGGARTNMEILMVYSLSGTIAVSGLTLAYQGAKEIYKELNETK